MAMKQSLFSNQLGKVIIPRFRRKNVCCICDLSCNAAALLPWLLLSWCSCFCPSTVNLIPFLGASCYWQSSYFRHPLFFCFVLCHSGNHVSSVIHGTDSLYCSSCWGWHLALRIGSFLRSRQSEIPLGWDITSSLNYATWRWGESRIMPRQ